MLITPHFTAFFAQKLDFIMSDAAAPAPSPKKAAPKKPKTAPAHPPVATMVNAALAALKDRKGSSLAAIKKYVAANNKVDIDRLAPFIRKYLKKAVTDGKITQVKGTGASGSFKLNKPAKEDKPKKKPAAKKPKAAKKPAKKAKTPKKAAKKPAAKKPAKKAKTPKKEKKAAKPKAAKPKKPAAKKTPKKAAKKPAAKKPAAKKAAKK